jgi:hypothetical protein
MPRFTIVANTQKPVLYLDFQGETSGQLFDNLLTGNPKSTSVPKLLMASDEFKDRLWGDRGQVPVPILKISVLHTYSLVLF